MFVRISPPGRRRSRIQKYIWPAAAVMGAAASAKCQGLGVSVPTVPYEFSGGFARNSAISSTFFDSALSQNRRFPTLENINLSPASALHFMDNLFLDAGANAVRSLKQYYSFWDAAPNYVGADGQGWRWGNIGLTWDFAKHQHLSFTYQAPMAVDDNNRFSGFTEAGAGTISALNPAVLFPTVIGLGYGIELAKTFSVETEIAWLDFTHSKSPALSAGNGPGAFSMAGTAPINGHSALASGIGADWKFAEHWVLHAGYQFFENPIHNSAFSPSIPDVNQHVFTLGVGWNGRHGSVDLAYGMDFYYDRHIANDSAPGFDGSYGFNGHLLSLAYKFTF